MLIGLHDCELDYMPNKTFPNFALMKISAWHKAKGDTVEWDNDMALFAIDGNGISYNFDNVRDDEIDVIGNIHENSELLEVEKWQNTQRFGMHCEYADYKGIFTQNICQKIDCEKLDYTNILFLLCITMPKDDNLIDKIREKINDIFDEEKQQIKEIEKAIDNDVSLEEIMSMPMPDSLREKFEEIIKKEE